MYSLTCPSCEKKTRSPFIRIGAVVNCAECDSKVQIRSEHVRRHIRIKPELDEDDLFTKAIVERAIEEEITASSPQAEASPASTPDADLASITETPMVEEEHPDLHAIAAVTAPPKHDANDIATTALRASTTRSSPRKRKKQKTGPSPMMLAGGGVLAVGLIIGVIAMLSGGGNGTDSTTRDASTKDSIATKDSSAVVPNKDATQPKKDGKNGTKDQSKVGKKDGKKDGKKATKDGKNTKDGKAVPRPSIVKLKAESLGTPAWQMTSVSFRPSIPANLVQLENVKRQNTDTGATFSADVTANQLILSALILIELINEEDRVYAAFEVPVAMLSATQPRKVYLDVPAEYLGALDYVHWEVTDVAPPKAQMVLLTNARGEITTNGDQSTVKVFSKNPDKRELIKSGFILAATDIDGRLLGQWKMDYDKSIQGNANIEFTTSVTIADAKKVKKWAVYGAGLPENAPPVVPITNPNNSTSQPPKNPDDRDLKPIRRPRRNIFDF